MLSKKAPETLPTTLTLKGQGETVKLNITYHNRKQSDLDAQIAEGKTVAEVVLYMVKEWDADYELSTAGLTELEDDRPGALQAVMIGFHRARHMELEKN
jgi:hypothetical protein